MEASKGMGYILTVIGTLAGTANAIPMDLSYIADAAAETGCPIVGHWGSDSDHQVNAKAQALDHVSQRFYDIDPYTGELYYIDLDLTSTASAEAWQQSETTYLKTAVQMQGWVSASGGWGAIVSGDAQASVSATMGTPEGFQGGIPLELEVIASFAEEIFYYEQHNWSLSIWANDPNQPLAVLDRFNLEAQLPFLAGQPIHLELIETVNDDGGVYGDCNVQVALTVTPEPATIGMLALGGSAVLRRRKHSVL